MMKGMNRRPTLGGELTVSPDPLVKQMAGLRMLSAAIEITAALLMLRFNRLDTALRINGLLGLVGPLVLLAVTAVGLIGLAGRVHPRKLLTILVGVALILAGTRSS